MPATPSRRSSGETDIASRAGPPAERQAAEQPRHFRHLALDQRAVTSGKGEVALAGDDDAVRPRHSQSSGSAVASARASTAARPAACTL